MLFSNRKKQLFSAFFYFIAFSGLWYLHDQNVVHGDIKPQNVLLSYNKKNVKICDFGVSRIKASKQATRTCTSRHTGTEGMAAPEVLLQKVRCNRHTDIWSFAATLVELFVQKEPWNKAEAGDIVQGEYLRALMKEKLLPHNLHLVEEQDADVHRQLTAMFSYKPSDRPTAHDVCSFFRGEDSD